MVALFCTAQLNAEKIWQDVLNNSRASQRLEGRLARVSNQQLDHWEASRLPACLNTEGFDYYRVTIHQAFPDLSFSHLLVFSASKSARSTLLVHQRLFRSSNSRRCRCRSGQYFICTTCCCLGGSRLAWFKGGISTPYPRKGSSMIRPSPGRVEDSENDKW